MATNLNSLSGFANRVWDGTRLAAGAYWDALKCGGIRRTNRSIKDLRKYLSSPPASASPHDIYANYKLHEAARAARRKAVAQTALAYGTTSGALYGTGCLGKSLYDKYAE